MSLTSPRAARPSLTRPVRRTLAAGASVLLLSALAGCGGDDETATSAGDDAPDRDASGPSCTYTPEGEAAKQVDLPPDQAVFTGDAEATIATSAGDIVATLDGQGAPCTVNSFVSLADQGYFDDTPCHRLTTSGIFVLQCGDPSGTGRGGPGYSFPDELTGDETYGEGVLAMANAGPNTNGSQFFIVYGESPLPPSYTVFGTIDAASLEVVTQVAEAGADDANGPGDGAPNTAVQITGVTVG